MQTMLRTCHQASQPRQSAPHAGSRDVTVNTRFTGIPGVIAQAPAQSASPVATAQSGQAVQVYVGRSIQGTWPVPVKPDQGATADADATE